MQIFFFWDRLWFSDECARRLNYIPYLGSLAFNFYLKQRQRFSDWSFNENASFISFHRRIWSRYSEINKLKISKDLSFFKNNKNPLKLHVSKTTSSIKLFTLRDIHYDKSKYWSVETKWNLNKETSSKSCQINDFRDSVQSIFSIDIKFSKFSIKIC